MGFLPKLVNKTWGCRRGSNPLISGTAPKVLCNILRDYHNLMVRWCRSFLEKSLLQIANTTRVYLYIVDISMLNEGYQLVFNWGHQLTM